MVMTGQASKISALSAVFRAVWICCLLVLPVVSQVRLDNRRMQDTMLSRYGETGLFAYHSWQQMLQQAEGRPTSEQLQLVNRFFNLHVEWQDDWQIWQQEDYWASPMETLGMAAGDCEDYSIAKYMSLRLLGVPNDQLRMIYVNAQLDGQSVAHMVLGFYEHPRAIPLILDNIDPRVVAANQRPDLQPVFSFNDQGLWVGNAVNSAAEPTARLSRWGDVLTRMRQEGWRF